MKKSFTLSVALSLPMVLIFVFLVFISGCSGSGSGTGSDGSLSAGNTVNEGGSGTVVTPSPVSSPSSSADDESAFTGYLYVSADVQEETRSAGRAGLVVLKQSNPPKGYRAVPGAVFHCESDSGKTALTDASGCFRFRFGQEDLEGATLIIQPPAGLKFLACIRHRIYKYLENHGDVNKLMIHPNARAVKAGDILQLYARVVTHGAGCNVVDPAGVKWEVDDESIAVVSPEGVLEALQPGLAKVTVTLGDLKCTGRYRIIQGRQAYSLSGTVMYENGNPAEGAVVSVSGSDSVAVADSEGSYFIPDLPGNTPLQVMVNVNGVLVYASGLTLTGSTVLDITIEPDSLPRNGGVAGTVSDGQGKPISGVLISTGEWDAITDDTGRYSISEIPEGAFTFNFDRDGYQSVSVSADITAGKVLTLDMKMEPVVTSPETGILKGRVVDADSMGISGAGVTYSAVKTRISAGRSAVTADVNGYFSFGNVETGSYKVSAQCEGYESGSVMADVLSGGETDVIVRLQAVVQPSPSPSLPAEPSPSPSPLPTVGTVAGQVRDLLNGVNLSGVSVSVSSLNGVSDSDGRFEIAGVPAGEHALVVALQGYAGYSASVDVPAGGQVDLTVELEKLMADSYSFSAKWGSYGSGDGQFYYPRGLVIDGDDNIYVADSNNKRVQKFDSSGAFILKWGTAGYGNGQFNSPFGIGIDGEGYVYVGDATSNNVQKFDSSGNFILKWGSYGTGNGQFINPVGITSDNGGYIYVTDFNGQRVQKFSSAGVFVTGWGSEGSAEGQFQWPYGIAFDESGSLLICDYGNQRVQKFNTQGAYVDMWGELGTGPGQFINPVGIALTRDNPLGIFVVDSGANCIQKFDGYGSFITSWGTAGANDGQFSWPHGVGVDSAGNVFVLDTTNCRVQKFLPVY